MMVIHKSRQTRQPSASTKSYQDSDEQEITGTIDHWLTDKQLAWLGSPEAKNTSHEDAAEDHKKEALEVIDYARQALDTLSKELTGDLEDDTNSKL